MKNKLGRPSKLTPEIKDKLLRLIRLGSPLESASKACGLDYNTVRDWVQRGKGTHKTRQPTPEYVDFAVAFDKALADGEAILLANINQASRKDWKAAAWLLSRRNPERWGERKLSSLEDLGVLLAGYGLLPKDKIEELMKLSDDAKESVKNILSGEGENTGGVKVQK